MALVRVYCGLASAYPPRRLAAGSPSLTATILDDAGRTVDVCEIGDDAYGYAYLSASLAERATGPYSVAIASDSDRRLVTRLLVAAGWALAIVDEETTGELAERFADDQAGERAAPDGQRRALGLARALQAGAASAHLLPVAPDLTELKPVLAAHSALATGRHAAAVALREVLRELYPAALRAYSDPADPVALAVIETLPEPGMLTGEGGREAAVVDAAAGRLADAGVADQSTVSEAVAALRMAVAETPRRGQLSRELAATVAETVRQAAAAVRACDAANTALVGSLVSRTAPPAERVDLAAQRNGAAAYPPGRNGAAADAPSGPEYRPAAGREPADEAEPTPRRAAGRRSARAPGSVPPGSPAGPRPSAEGSSQPERAAQPAPSGRAASLRTGASWGNHARSAPPAADAGGSSGQHNRPMSPPPPPPPGITPIREPQEPTRQGRREAAAEEGRAAEEPRTPAPRPAPDRSPHGSRGDWPTSPPPDDWAMSYANAGASSYATGPPAESDRHPEPAEGYPGDPQRGYTSGPAGGGYAEPHRANGDRPAPYRPDQWASPDPSWSADAGWRAEERAGSSAPERSGRGERAERPETRERAQQRTLRLVEPAPPEGVGYPEPPADPDPSPPLRLVEPSSGGGGAGGGVPRSVPPVSADDGDDDLLIFAQTRSAWFDQDPSAAWSSAMDLGWQAAEQASQPTIGERTGAGLPRRVPHANLVPGAPPRREEQPLRVVRDPASIAAHTSGYFSGWRKGQEVGGFPLGNRPARRAAGAWEFHRDEDRLSG